MKRIRKFVAGSGNRRSRPGAVLAPLLTVSGIETGPEHLDVALQPFPQGVAEVISRVRNLF